MLARGKDLSKKLLTYHRIPVPQFAVFPMGRKVRRPPRLGFPLIVKSLSEDASRGIAQASVVENDEKLAERVAFIHERIGTAVIAEQYIDGRELYVGVLGNDRVRVLPIWELAFEAMPGRPIATARVKHDARYQERRGIVQGPAEDLPPDLQARIQRMAKRICRTLQLDGYNRIDLRLSADCVPYFLEANPNPDLGPHEELARGGPLRWAALRQAARPRHRARHPPRPRHGLRPADIDRRGPGGYRRRHPCVSTSSISTCPRTGLRSARRARATPRGCLSSSRGGASPTPSSATCRSCCGPATTSSSTTRA